MTAQAETVVTEEDLVQNRAHSPYADRAYPDQVFFGSRRVISDA